MAVHGTSPAFGSYAPRALLHCEDLDGADVGVGVEQVRCHLTERPRNLAVEMGLTGFLRLEGVEDPVGRIVDLERVPRDRSFLGCGDLPTATEEGGQVVALSRLRLEE